MNHSLFIEMHQMDIEKQDAIELLHKGKIIFVNKEGNRTVLTLKGNGWRGWLEVVVEENTETEVVSTAMLDLSQYINIPMNAVIMGVKAECNDEIEECRIEYEYVNITYTISLISVIDIDIPEKTDDVILRFIAKYLTSYVFMNLVRPM